MDLIKNQQGQSVVEYILLFIVSASLIVTFYRSATFKRLFGDQGQFGQLYKQEAEWGYRHAFLKGRIQGETSDPYPGAESHPSYFNANSGDTRFFGPNDPYK